MEKDLLYSLNDQFQQVPFYKLVNNCCYGPMTIGGITSLQAPSDNNSVIINHVNMKCYDTQTDMLRKYNFETVDEKSIDLQICLCDCGLSFTDRILLRVMGKADLG